MSYIQVINIPVVDQTQRRWEYIFSGPNSAPYWKKNYARFTNLCLGCADDEGPGLDFLRSRVGVSRTVCVVVAAGAGETEVESSGVASRDSSSTMIMGDGTRSGGLLEYLELSGLINNYKTKRMYSLNIVVAHSKLR